SFYKIKKFLNFHPPPPVRTDFDIPIFQKTYDFVKELYLVLPKLPKRQRYTLGQRLDNLSIEFLESIILAGRAEAEKLSLLKKADSKLETLKILLRLAKDTQTLDNGKYANLEKHLQEIGKMLGGWLKHAKQAA
ncbi:MAG: diversity-generating retroelement protein Avd, partial [Candidatus Woykebacteria bacterium]